MHISLIGMSNIGKSYWSRKLAATEGFEHVDCDTLVEHKLAGELIKLGYQGIHDVAKWMGQPYDAQYPDTSRKYLTYEREVMLEVIDRLRDPETPPLVVDTTGSVIYTGDDIGKQLRVLSHVVYFQASDQHVSKLFDRYMSNPKPVIWGDRFAVQSGETLKQTLQRCYPDLLAYRAERYHAIAHIALPFERHKTPNITWQQMMSGT